MTSNQDESDQILQALRLGWLTVEAFARLRRWARSGRAPAPIKGDARQRFDFSDREPSPTDQVLTALQQLEMISAIVVPDMKPPIPDNPDVLFEHARQDIDAVWVEFEIGAIKYRMPCRCPIPWPDRPLLTVEAWWTPAGTRMEPDSISWERCCARSAWKPLRNGSIQ